MRHGVALQPPVNVCILQWYPTSTFKPHVEKMCPVFSRSSSLICLYILPLDVINTWFYSKHQVFYLGPLVHSAIDNPKGVTAELQSALGEINFLSTKSHVKRIIGGRGVLHVCLHAFDVCVIIKSWLYFPRCSVLEVVCGRCSVAQEPGGGTSHRGAGVQRGHAAHAGALHWTHSCHLHGSAVLRCWYGDHTFRL